MTYQSHAQAQIAFKRLCNKFLKEAREIYNNIPRGEVSEVIWCVTLLSAIRHIREAKQDISSFINKSDNEQD